MASKDLPIDLLKADINNIKKYIQKALQEETINESLLSEGIDTLGNISPTIKPKAFIKYVLKYIELVIIFGNGRDYYTQATVTRKYFNHITDMIPAEVQEEFLRQGTRLVFDYVLEENTENWCIKKELLRFFNDTSLDCKRKVKHDIVDKLPQIYLLKLVDSVTSCADYDLQAVILELIFRMYSQRIIHSKLYELIPESEELTSLFSQIKAVTFDEDLKKFLNTLNAKYDKVFTLLCTDIILDNTCSIPVEEGFDVHFNVWHKALSWYQLQQDEDGHETWELITVFVSNVDIAYTRNKKEEPEKLFLEIKLNGPCLTSLTSYQESRDVIRDITIVTKKSEITDEHLYRSLLQKFFDGKFRILPNENLNILRTDVIPAPENESIEQLPTSNQSDESSLDVLDPATTTLHDSRISSKNISTDESKRLLTSSGSVAEIISIVTTTEHDVTTDLSEHRTSPIKNLTPLKILGGRCTGRAVIYKNLIRSQGSSVEQNFTESIQKTNQNFNISVEESKDETEYSTAIEDPDTSTSELTEQFESMKVVIDHRRSSKEKALSKPKSIKELKSKNNNQRTKTKKKQNESTTGKHKPGSGNYVIEEDNYVSPPTLTVLPKVKPSPTVDETERDQKKMSFKISTCIKTTKTAKENGLKTKPLKGIKIKKSKKPVLDILGQKFDHDNENKSSAAVSASTQQNTSEKSVKISASDGTDEYNSQKSPIESQETFSESSKGKTNNSISEEKFIEGIDVNEKSLEHEKTFPAQDETERDPKKMLSSKVSTCIKTKNDAKENELKTKVSSNLKGTKINKSKKTVNQKKTEFDHGNESQHLAAVSALTQQNAKDLLQSVKVSAFDRTREYGSQKILVEPEESVLGTKETISEEFDSNYLLPPTRIVLPKASTSKITVSESKGKADDSISEEECIELIDVKEKSLEQQQTFPAVDETGRDQKKMLSSKVSTCTKTTKSAKDHQIKPSVPSVLEGKEVIKKSKKPMRSKHRRRSDVLDQEVDHDNESQPSTVVSAFSQQDARDLLQSLKISAFDRTHEYGSQKSLIESEENVLGTEENVLGTKEIISEEFDSNYLLPPTRMILPKASTCKITISETKGNVDNAISEEESIEVIDVKEKSLEQQQTFPTIDETGRDQKKMLSSKVSTCTKTTKNAKDHQIKPSVPSVLEGVEVIKKSKKPMRSKHLRRSDVLDQEVENDNESQPLTVVSALTQQNSRDIFQSVKASAFDRTREYGSQKSLVESEESVLGTKETMSEEFDSNYLLPPTRTILPKASTCKITVSESKSKADDSISEEECIELIDVKEKSLEQQQTFPTVDETGRDQKTMLSSKVSTCTRTTKSTKDHQIKPSVPSVLEGIEVIKKSKKPMRSKHLRHSDVLDQEVDHGNESQPSTVVSALTQQNAKDLLQSVKASAFDRTREYGSQKSMVESKESVLGTKEIISEEFDSNYLLPPTRTVLPKASTCKITVSETKGNVDNAISEEESIEVIDVKEKSLEQQQTFPTVDETARDQKKMLSSKVSTSTKTTKSAKDHQIKPSVPSVLEGKEVIKKSKKPMRSKHLRRSDVLDQEVDHDNESQPSTVVSALTQQDARDLLQSVKISAFDRTHEYDSQKSLIESEESVLSTKEIISEKFDSNYLLPPTRTVLPKASTCKINVSGSKDKMHISISDEECIEVIDVKEETLEQQETFPSVVETERDRTKKSSSKVSSAVKGTKIKKSKKPVRAKNLRRSDILGEEFDHDNESQPSAAVSALTQQNASERSVKISAFDEAGEYEPQKKPPVSSVLEGMEVIKKSKTPVQTKPVLCADILDREKKFENQKEIQSVSGLKEQNIKEKPVKISSFDRKNSIEISVNQEIISENTVTEEVHSKYFLPPRLSASPNSTCVEKSFTVTDVEEVLEQQKILPTIEEDERNRKEILSLKVSACIKTTRKAKGKKLKPQQRKKLTTLKEQNTRETPVKISIFDKIEENVTGSNKENEQPALETFADSPIKMKSKRFENEQQKEEEEKIFKPPDAVSPEVSITKYASHESSIHNDLEHGKELGNQKEKPKLSDTTSNLNANLNSKDTEQVLTFPKLIVLLERFDSNLQKKRTISKPIEDVSENRKSEQIQSMSNDLNLNNIEEKSIKSLKGSTAKVEKENIMNNTTMEPVVTLIENSEHQNEKEKLKSSKSTTQSLRKTQKRPKGTQIVVSHDDEVIQDFIGSKNIRQSSFSDPKVKEKICDKEKTTAKLHIVRSVIETSEKITGEKMYDDKMTHVDKVMQEAAIPISKSSDIDLNLKNIEQVPSFNQLVELLDRQSSFSDPKIKEKICDKEKSTAKLQISGEKMYDDKMTHDEKVMQESAVPTSKSTDIGVGLQNIEQSPSFDQLVELLDRYGYGVQKKTTVSKPIEDVSEKSKEPVLSTVIDVKECGLADDEKDTQASTLDIDVSSQVIQAKSNVQEEIIDDDLKQGEKSEGPRSKKIHISESSSDETECEGNSVLDEELNESIIIMKIDKTIGNNKIDLVQPILQNEKDDTCIRNTSVKDIEVTTMLDHSEKNLSEKGQEDIIRRPRALNAVLTDSDMSIEDFSSEVQKLPPADKKDGGEENSVKTLSNEKPLEFDRLAADNKKVISGEKKTKEVNEKNKENNFPPTEPKVIPIERSCIADKTNNSSIRRKRKLYDPNDLSVFSHLEDEVERYEKMTKEQQIEMEEGIDKSNTIDKSRLLLLSSAKEGHSSTTYKKKSASLNFVKKYQDPSINGRINLTTSYVRSKKPKKGTNSRNRSYLSGMITLHKRNKHESSVNISKADQTMLNRTLHKIFGWPDEGDSFLKKVLKKSHANASELKTQEYVESQDENTGSPVIVKAKGPTKKKRLPNDQIRYADLIRARDARSHKAKETFMKILQDIQDDLNDGESLMDMLRKSKEKPTAKEKRSSKNRSRRSKTKANNSSKVKRSNVPQKRRSSTPHRSDQCSSNKKRKIKKIGGKKKEGEINDKNKENNFLPILDEDLSFQISCVAERNNSNIRRKRKLYDPNNLSVVSHQKDMVERCAEMITEETHFYETREPRLPEKIQGRLKNRFWGKPQIIYEEGVEEG
uniref:Uncharacterized protein LOC114342049 isoform X2 n=1 Tax=Diabrotica virgifera virgifera TaxID=50390 RepID=A0A6P7GG33_DIAVI